VKQTFIPHHILKQSSKQNRHEEIDAPLGDRAVPLKVEGHVKGAKQLSPHSSKQNNPGAYIIIKQNISNHGQYHQEHNILLSLQWNQQQCWPEKKSDTKLNEHRNLLIKYMLEQV
jgi:hypothetical protein